MKFLTAWLFFVVQCSAVIVPSDRVYPWQGNVGIPGGITNRSSIFANVRNAPYNAVGDDVHDDTTAIQSAINACPAGQVVYIPAGEYRVTAQLSVNRSITVRGDGPSLTIIDAHGTGAIFAIGGPIGTYLYYLGGSPLFISTITGGATKGSSSFTVSSATGITNGSLMNVDQLNPDFVNPMGNEGYNGNGSRTYYSTNTAAFGSQQVGTRLLGQVVYVTNVSGTTISFDPPLIWDFTNSPQATAYQCFTVYAGIENLKLYANNSGYDFNVTMFTCAYCWVKNIECDYADGDHLVMDSAVRCEVRDSYFHDGYLHGPGQHDDTIKARGHSSGCLIENNIMRRLHNGVIFMWGGGGHVVAYNYVTNGFDQGATLAFYPDFDFHGAHVMQCLFEGNVAGNMNQDGVWGSASHNTFARNFFSGANWNCPPYSGRGAEQTNSYLKEYDGIWMNNLAWNTFDFNFVGNIFGCSDFEKIINGTSHGWAYMQIWPADPCWDNCPSEVWSIGYADVGQGNGFSASTAAPLYSLINHGNWDIVTGAIQWSNSIPDHVIPQSYYLASKPGFFGSLAWPPIDPGTAATDNTTQITNVPAVRTYFGLPITPASSGSTPSIANIGGGAHVGGGARVGQ